MANPRTSKQVLTYLLQKDKRAKGVQMSQAHTAKYWYFHDGIADKFYEQNCHVTRISDLSLDQWLETFQYKCDDVAKRQGESLPLRIRSFLEAKYTAREALVKEIKRLGGTRKSGIPETYAFSTNTGEDAMSELLVFVPDLGYKFAENDSGHGKRVYKSAKLMPGSVTLAWTGKDQDVAVVWFD